ncbi:CDP-diacylglycerol--glycerol-3-phosphate 3-phosphatidyltransferase [Natranaerovirga pectinivora]|uniref:CDP-diacylglycerol--glycerol-3-phosphate 3-phosphatidyltransferase n=1 Tax=Natranaerovirga pectinivora TaxID=682400 RepID=A0A4R3MKP4_9FIRM|nr:CDP-diacylglycerol--glycerol-3-phosphate 3-phosphatidyltransferase [Natranaerovirga pectinivora]TCT15033.1 CDP-diacylglycerol--glycerol-3-phosphate 3-phosphatidyltransferase [Natranaerovirga pectinivora]
MNIANKLTILRVMLIPIFLVFILTDFTAMNHIYALVIFAVASFTDFLDGYLARSMNLVTNFGKFMDPLADKLLVASALIAFVYLGWLAPWVVILIISREFLISGFRVVAASEGLVIAASKWGKIKTVFQMVMILVLMARFDGEYIFYIENALVYIAVIFTIISAVDYMVKNKHVLTEGSK